jgi:hypothetical protein
MLRSGLYKAALLDLALLFFRQFYAFTAKQSLIYKAARPVLNVFAKKRPLRLGLVFSHSYKLG